MATNTAAQKGVVKTTKAARSTWEERERAWESKAACEEHGKAWTAAAWHNMSSWEEGQ